MNLYPSSCVPPTHWVPSSCWIVLGLSFEKTGCIVASVLHRRENTLRLSSPAITRPPLNLFLHIQSLCLLSFPVGFFFNLASWASEMLNSAGKGMCLRSWQPDFHLQIPCDGRRKSTSARCPLTCIYALTHVYLIKHACVHPVLIKFTIKTIKVNLDFAYESLLCFCQHGNLQFICFPANGINSFFFMVE